jgi:uroporphyrinogen-III synthase
LIEIAPIPVTGTFADAKHVVFTSLNGVAQAKRIGIPEGITAWCVGPRTGQAASDLGFDVRVAGGNSHSLVTLIVAQAPVGRMVHLRGRHVAGKVIDDLRSARITCETVVSYDQVAIAPTQAALDLLCGETPVIVPLFSPRSAKLFGQIADFNAPLHLVALSEAIDVAQQNAPVVSRTIAKSRDGAGMITATLARYAQISP